MTEENKSKELTAEDVASIEGWKAHPYHMTVDLPKKQFIDEALQAIKDRSFSGRHPELGKMINCHCGLRHRENERKCEQKFYIELTPPEGLTQLTARQIFGAAMFNRRRQRPRNRPKNKMHYWLRVILDARKKKNDNE